MKLARGNGNGNTTGLLGKGVEVSGEIHFSDTFHIEGKVAGKLVSETGTLVIEETGRVEAEVNVGVCIVRGALEGNINAQSRIEISKTGRVGGDLMTPVLLIEEGAVFNGSVGMSQGASSRASEEIRLVESQEKTRVKGA
ncbi:MAG TPA: polymer-forming cytoskeletal protein [Blastocatellia bacterium]|nr:polymer-forming cytoskeletal protein [Blastocatellia bacterium]